MKTIFTDQCSSHLCLGFAYPARDNPVAPRKSKNFPDSYAWLRTTAPSSPQKTLISL